MKNECNSIHLPNFKSTCCLRHLVEMSKYAEMQMLTKNYAKLLLEVLNRSFKLKYIQYSKMKLDLFLSITNVLTKYISHFFLINKLDYAQLLCKISIQGFKETAFKDHPEVILRQIAINNNISCIYEAKGKLKKAWYYLNKNREYVCISNSIDNAILYNNLIRICYQLNNKEELKELMNEFAHSLEEEVKTARANSMKQTLKLSSTMSVNNISLTQSEAAAKNQMLSFLYYNLGIALEKFCKCAEGKEAFTKGYEFSISVLGEHHLYTHKFRTKLKLKELHKKNGGFNYTKQSQSLNKSVIEKIKIYNKPKSFSIDKSQYHFPDNSRNRGVDDYKLKLDIIYDFILNQNERQETRRIQSETEPSSSNLSNIARDNQTYSQLKIVLKPFLQKCINHNALKATTTTKKALIDEVLREFEVTKKRNLIYKQGSSSETAVSIKTIKKPIHTQMDQKPEIRFKKEAEKVKNDGYNKIDSSIIEINSSSNSIELNKGSFNSKFTFKEQTSDDNRNSEDEGSISRRRNDNNIQVNDLKPKSNSHSCFNEKNGNYSSEKDMALATPTVNIIFDKEEVPFEFQPFYRENKAYKRTIQNVIVSQNNVKFQKQGNKASVFQDFLKGGIFNSSNQGLPKQFQDSPSNNNNEPQTFNVISYNINPNPTTSDNDTNNSSAIGIASIQSTNVLNILKLEDYIEKEEEIIMSDTKRQKNYLETKLNSKDNQKDLFDKLIKQSSNNTFCISTLFSYQNNYMKIAIMQNTKSAPIVFMLFNPNDPSEVLSELSIDLSKIKGIIEQVNLFKTLPRFIDLNQLNTLEDLMRKVLVYHCNIIKQDSKYSTGICPKPNSLCGDKQISFKFLKTQCTMDLIVINKYILRIIITYAKNLDIFLIIDCDCDDSSFNDILSAIPNQFPISPNETFIPVYKFNEKQMGKDGLIRLILKETQDIIKYKVNNQEISFNSLHKDLNDYLFQCTIRNHCNKVDYWDISPNKSNKEGCYDINHWHFEKENEEKHSEMKSSSSININSDMLNSLFDSKNSTSEFNQILLLLNEREKGITKYLILNSFDCDNDNNVKLIKPKCLYNFTTFVDNDNTSLLHLLIVQYKNEQHYLAKIIYYNCLSNYEYSIILLPSVDTINQTSKDIIVKISSKKRVLSALLNEVYKEFIEKNDIPLVKYLPSSFLSNKFD